MKLMKLLMVVARVTGRTILAAGRCIDRAEVEKERLFVKALQSRVTGFRFPIDCSVADQYSWCHSDREFQEGLPCKPQNSSKAADSDIQIRYFFNTNPVRELFTVDTPPGAIKPNSMATIAINCRAALFAKKVQYVPGGYTRRRKAREIVFAVPLFGERGPLQASRGQFRQYLSEKGPGRVIGRQVFRC